MLVLHQAGSHVGEHGIAVFMCPVQFPVSVTVAHFYFSIWRRLATLRLDYIWSSNFLASSSMFS
ncbi:MAG: hypothetical protein ACK5SF_10755, partial [Hyphomonadaceae bacterium]